jgi:glycosyltransferase involved in cell wall biosynthesis
MITLLTIISLLLALLPALLFSRNLGFYARLPEAKGPRSRCSVLIPARNEELNIEAALESVLRSDRVDFEVIVLDDSSSDGTADIVNRIARRDARVRLATARPLAPKWCGKSFACQQLAELARHPILVFMDADVRVERPDSLARLIAFMDESKAALVSGVPREETGGLLERLIIPLIHFVLLGFLPFRKMRSSKDPCFAAACGQILAVGRDAYLQTGGHAAVAEQIHDGVALTRNLRSHGFATDLFDATDTFSCRMYRRGIDVWNGFAKNAHEGLASRRLIVPATFMLFGGQILPVLLLALANTPLTFALTIAATLAAYLPRIVGVFRFHQSLLGALLHPIGVLLLLAIQWYAFAKTFLRQPASWKGRSYSPATSS